MTAIVLRGDARRLPLPDSSVDLVVTSPPYFALRSYTDGGEHYDGQIGSEPTPAEWLAVMWDCTREMARVLKPSGSLFVNLGDKYCAGVSGRVQRTRDRTWMPHSGKGLSDEDRRLTADEAGVPVKSLLGLPWRYAIGCIDRLGLTLRAEIVWSKPNGLPESVTDRVRRSHEQWFHFTVRPRYYAAVDEVREPVTGGSHLARRDKGMSPKQAALAESGDHGVRRSNTDPSTFNPLGKLPGSVWDIPSEPLTVPVHLGVDHFAAFPTEWPRRLILGWSPPGICAVCGEGLRPVVDRAVDAEGRTTNGPRNLIRQGRMIRHAVRAVVATDITGYACACRTPGPTRPSVVLDPFGGTGTTALVASVLGRVGVSVDRSADYSRLAQWRTTDPQQRCRAARVEPPPAEIDGQRDMFEDVG